MELVPHHYFEPFVYNITNKFMNGFSSIHLRDLNGSFINASHSLCNLLLWIWSNTKASDPQTQNRLQI